MSELARVFENDRFAARNGIQTVEVGEGRAVARMTVGPEHMNAAGVAQGGAIFTLADFTFGLACNSRGKVALAIEAHVTFLRPVGPGVLRAEGREESASRRLSTCTVRVTDASGTLVALFTGTAFRKDDPQAPP